MYRKWPVDVLEIFFYLNILSFATFTWYSLDNPDSNQEAAAYTSVIITFIVLLLIIFYHVYIYTTVFSKIKKKMCGRIIDGLDPDHPPSDDDINLLDVIDHPYIYKPPKLKQQKPVKSAVEVHQPHDQLAASDPEEVTNTQQRNLVKPTHSVVELPIPSDLAASDPEHRPGIAEAI